MPLDGEASSVTAGTIVLTEAPLTFISPGGGFLALRFSTHKRVVERRIVAVGHQSLAWGGQTGGSTVLSLDKTLALHEGGATAQSADIRDMSFHHVDGDAFSLTAPPEPTAAASGSDLFFYGSAADADALTGRTVLLAGPGAALAEAQVAATKTSGAAADPAFHRVTLDHAVNYADFTYDQSTVTVYGNLVAATEGKSE